MYRSQSGELVTLTTFTMREYFFVGETIVYTGDIISRNTLFREE